MEEKEFNILKEPWIRVRLPDCSIKEVSLTEALLKNQSFSGLAGELPTQDVAVMRLLLAVLHTVFSRMDENGACALLQTSKDALERWKTLWSLKQFPRKPIEDYLETQQEKFWLFHPTRPFGQVPEAVSGTAYTAAKLNGEISESSNKVRLFPMRTGEAKEGIGYAEAARWLLYVNAFDDSAVKPKGKGLPSPGVGWLGKLGLIYAEGDNLFETLLLNMTLLKNGNERWEVNIPEWELEKARSAERTEIPLPDNPAQLLTLQSRRLLLQQKDGFVIGYNALSGDFFEEENAFSEQMTVWKKRSDKSENRTGFCPYRHDASKQMWQEFGTMFVNKRDEGVHLPGIVEWVKRMEREKLLKKEIVRFGIVSVQYCDKKSSVTDVFSDSLSLHSSLFSELGAAWQERIEGEIEFCNKLAAEIAYLATNLSKAAGGQENGEAKTAKEQFYFRLDAPFRRWLYSLNPGRMKEGIDEKCEEWRKQAVKLACELGRELVDNTGQTAFIGRDIKEKIKGKPEVIRHYSAPEAYNWFCYKVHTI
ncbi:MAG: type I-E CRISPR-associated protein Cse1/CasA [Lachnospiraceae bacterium]